MQLTLFLLFPSLLLSSIFCLLFSIFRDVHIYLCVHVCYYLSEYNYSFDLYSSFHVINLTLCYQPLSVHLFVQRVRVAHGDARHPSEGSHCVHTVFYPAVRIEEVKKTFNFFFLFSFIYFLTWGMGDGWVSENLMLPCLP